MSHAGSPSDASSPLPLDALADGIDLLDAILVLHLADAHLHASWVRPEGGVRPDEVITTLRDAYRVAQFASRRLLGGLDRRVESPAPVLSIELPLRTVLLRRIRTHLVVCIFDAAMPLGMARLIASRIAAALEPELPAAPEPTRPAPVVVSATPPAAQVSDAADQPPTTLSFGAGLPRRSRPPPPRLPEVDRANRLLAYLEAQAPEPHVAKLRLALRAGLTPAALERPESLGPEAMALIETAVEEILGVDRAELKRIA